MLPSTACMLYYFYYYIHRQSLLGTQKKEGRKGAQTLEKQGKKQPACFEYLLLLLLPDCSRPVTVAQGASTAVRSHGMAHAPSH
jgi:hypothetical protein